MCSFADAASCIRARTEKVACVLGGGFSGLAVAAKLADIGFGVLIVDAAPPGAAAASAAAAGLLDPLSPKGKILWSGNEAFAEAIELIWRTADIGGSNSPCAVATGCLHVARGKKQATALRESAAELGDSPLGIRYVDNVDAEFAAVCGGVQAPDGALYCRSSVVVDSNQYLKNLWAYIQAKTHAVWMQRHVEHCQALGDTFDIVVIAAGSGCTKITESRHLPLDLCRGQVIEYAPPPLPGTAELEALPNASSAQSTMAAGEASEREERDEQLCRLRELRVAISGSVYVLPHLKLSTQDADASSSGGNGGSDGSGSSSSSSGAGSGNIAGRMLDGPNDGHASRWVLSRLDCGGTYEGLDGAAPQGGPPQSAAPQLGPPQLGPPPGGLPPFGPPQLGPPQLGPPQGGPPQGLPQGMVPPRATVARRQAMNAVVQSKKPAARHSDDSNAAVAEMLLQGALLELFPPLRAAIGKPERARAGVRAAPPRTELGSLPLAGRAHAGASLRNVWAVGGMGSRGLLYHSIVASWLVDAATHDDETRIPEPVRRGGFGELLGVRISRLAEVRAREQGALDLASVAYQSDRRSL